MCVLCAPGLLVAMHTLPEEIDPDVQMFRDFTLFHGIELLQCLPLSSQAFAACSVTIVVVMVGHTTWQTKADVSSATSSAFDEIFQTSLFQFLPMLQAAYCSRWLASH